MADQARVGSMFQHCRRAGGVPVGNHSPQIHMPPVECQVRGVSPLGVFVRIPEFDRRIEIEHAMVVAPADDFAAVDVPGQVNEQIAGSNMAS